MAKKIIRPKLESQHEGIGVARLETNSSGYFDLYVLDPGDYGRRVDWHWIIMHVQNGQPRALSRIVARGVQPTKDQAVDEALEAWTAREALHRLDAAEADRG